MRRVSLVIIVSAIAATIGAFAVLVPMLQEESAPYSGKLPYTPSDMTRADERFEISPSVVPWKTTEISEIDTVVATFRGVVTDIGDPIDWSDDIGVVHGAIPVTIEVTENPKNSDGARYWSGSSFTFFVDSLKVGDIYHISAHEPEFEMGEDTIIHVAKAHHGPLGEGGDNYYVELGDFGKYKVVGQTAYNEKYHDGRPVSEALGEAK